MKVKLILVALAAVLLMGSSPAPKLDATQKDATKFTKEINAQLMKAMNRESIERESKLAATGLIAASDGLQIKRFNSDTFVWDMTKYAFLKGEAPETVNPKLWEHAKLNMNIGLYQVSENIYQVRGYDIANITFIRGEKGFIVIDPLTAQETAKAAYEFICEALGENLDVTAVIYTHSHTDHYAGVLGVTDGTTKVYAPDGFMDSVSNENLFAGVAMNRRTFYMYGTILEPGAKGKVDGGLGKGPANGTQSLVAPDVTITEATETHTIDGIEFIFQLTNGTEAPSEMNVYIPSEKSLCMAENCTATLHNLYTLRGAQVRDPEKWADYIDDAIKLFGGEATSVFSTHNWPRFGNDIVPYLQSQRDCYQYIRDQTLRLISQGYTIDEVGRMVSMPKSLSDDFFNGEFYGTVSHNAKAVYQKYLGWYDSNPVNLNKLLPEDSAKKYVDYMGGAEKVLRKAKEDYSKGEYQWVSEVTKQIIFADPDNKEAKLLCADALEQLGYIAESGPWRNEYLFAADELRNGVRLPDTGVVVKTDVYDALNAKQFATMLAIRLNGERAAGKNMTFAIECGDITVNLQLRNSVLAYLGETDIAMDFTAEMPKDSFYTLVSGGKGEVKYSVDGQNKSQRFDDFLSLLDMPDNRYNIVTP